MKAPKKAGLFAADVEYNNMETTKRPVLTRERVEEVRRVIAENPAMNRTQISRRICELWGWMSPSGYLKEISARDMLRALDKAGAISLPPPQSASHKYGGGKPPAHISHCMSPIECALGDLQPLRVEIAERGELLAEFKSLIDSFHYLKYSQAVGENLKYIIRSAAGEPLACMQFGSAAWSCRGRDRHIGWGKERRAEALHLLTNNSRCLVLPWVRVPFLASHALSIIARRISPDWLVKYGHGLLAIETFVETGRFRGTIYQAAGWLRVGRTAGRGRDGGHHEAILPQKDVYIYPLDRYYAERLRGDKPLRGNPRAAATADADAPAERAGRQG
jgi:hypothetical protein